MIDAEEIIGVQLFKFTKDAKHLYMGEWLPVSGYCQLREYYRTGITVHLLTTGALIFTGNTYIEGIPFDEDWAKRCGFINEHPEDPFYHIEIDINIYIYWNIQENILSINGYKIPYIKFLHQVMQLHFNLTGNVLKPDLTGL